MFMFFKLHLVSVVLCRSLGWFWLQLWRSLLLLTIVSVDPRLITLVITWSSCPLQLLKSGLRTSAVSSPFVKAQKVVQRILHGHAECPKFQPKFWKTKQWVFTRLPPFLVLVIVEVIAPRHWPRWCFFLSEVEGQPAWWLSSPRLSADCYVFLLFKRCWWSSNLTTESRL